jgi:SAM-dependent methyltransferase
MTTQIKNTLTKLTADTQELLHCPICSFNVEVQKDKFKCTNCQAEFPIVDGIPIFINENNSVFSINDYLDSGGTTLKPKSQLERLLVNLVPRIICNIKAKENFQHFAKLLLQKNKNPKVLIIGASVVGEGIECLLSDPEIELIESDVAFGPRISIIFDAHDIPFEDSSFDGVIIQAVLEHVVDPTRCVQEIYRVLQPNGLVYSETPFMQQVHLGKYDFTRYTHLGHRRLFRNFTEITSGAACGSGMALAWSYQYFLLSFVKSRLSRAIVKVFARITAFWLKYFDYYLINQPGSFDAASSYYFMGEKSEYVLSDRELLTLYKGTQSSSY